jgi:ribosomal protein S17E
MNIPTDFKRRTVFRRREKFEVMYDRQFEQNQRVVKMATHRIEVVWVIDLQTF